MPGLPMHLVQELNVGTALALLSTGAGSRDKG